VIIDKWSFQLTLKSKFIQSIPAGLCDPITGLRANNETELSALFTYYHSSNSIDWSGVDLYSPQYQLEKYSALEYIDRTSSFYCEYPLFSDSETVNIWGQMPADLLSFSQDKSNIVLIENKIGSKFTSGGTQLMRQAQYLDSTDFENKVLIVLTSKLFLLKGWYLNEMQEVQHKIKGVKVLAMHWEDVFNSIEFKS